MWKSASVVLVVAQLTWVGPVAAQQGHPPGPAVAAEPAAEPSAGERIAAETVGQSVDAQSNDSTAEPEPARQAIGDSSGANRAVPARPAQARGTRGKAAAIFTLIALVVIAIIVDRTRCNQCGPYGAGR